MEPTSTLSAEEMRRYARHFSIPGFGVEAQEKLKAARVLFIGAGGLGSPVSMYLAAAGVGAFRLVDANSLDLSNLQRQILHGQSALGRGKLASASEPLAEIDTAAEGARFITRLTLRGFSKDRRSHELSRKPPKVALYPVERLPNGR